MIVAHGTSYENYLKMMDGSNFYDKNWDPSENNTIYLYTGDDADTIIGRAFSSATLAAAIKKSESDRVVVIELDVDLSEVKPDNSCGLADLDPTIVCMTFDNFMKRRDQFEIHMFEYYPGDRWKYMYNLYHCCGGFSWRLAENHVVDKEEIVEKCDRWYEENHKCECWFDDICEMIYYDPKGWTITYVNWDDPEGKTRVIGRFKTGREKNRFLEKIYLSNSGFTEEELESVNIINDYDYKLPR